MNSLEESVGIVEIEVKIRVPKHVVQRTVTENELALVAPRALEDNRLYDTKSRDLGRRNEVLRIRRTRGCTSLTWKGPVDQADDRFKIRREITTRVEKGEALAAILASMGYHLWFHYEKYRTVYADPPVEVMVDETPIGLYVEIEGPPAAVEERIERWKWSEYPRTTANYYTLFLEARASGIIQGNAMVFSDSSPERTV